MNIKTLKTSSRFWMLAGLVISVAGLLLIGIAYYFSSRENKVMHTQLVAQDSTLTATRNFFQMQIDTLTVANTALRGEVVKMKNELSEHAKAKSQINKKYDDVKQVIRNNSGDAATQLALAKELVSKQKRLNSN